MSLMRFTFQGGTASRVRLAKSALSVIYESSQKSETPSKRNGMNPVLRAGRCLRDFDVSDLALMRQPERQKNGPIFLFYTPFLFR